MDGDEEARERCPEPEPAKSSSRAYQITESNYSQALSTATPLATSIRPLPTPMKNPPSVSGTRLTSKIQPNRDKQRQIEPYLRSNAAKVTALAHETNATCDEALLYAANTVGSAIPTWPRWQHRSLACCCFLMLLGLLSGFIGPLVLVWDLLMPSSMCDKSTSTTVGVGTSLS